MYNPINMVIEDKARLYERDLREKNKRKRFEVRYDVEAMTRKRGLADQAREDKFKANKISHLRFKEEGERGFDILTNDQQQKNAGANIVQPEGVWTKAIQTVNRGNFNGMSDWIYRVYEW